MKRKFNLDFVGVGAEKAGTTWLADCLREHPEIYVPQQKELFFFNEFDPHFLEVKNYKYSRGINWYKSQFNSADASLIGEVSPTYLYCRVAAERIKKHFPSAKILVILRDPVKRAYSQYVHDQRLGLIRNISFEKALKKYKSYTTKSMYSENISYYFRLFSKKNVLVLYIEDIKKNPSKVIKNVYKFLGTKNVRFKPKSLYKHPNKAGKARIFWLNFIMINTEYILRRNNLVFVHKILEGLGIRRLALAIREINSSRGNSYPNLSKKTENELRKTFIKDIQKLERVLGKDLSAWK